MHCGKMKEILASYVTTEVTAHAIIYTRTLNPSSTHDIERECFNVVAGVIQVVDSLCVHYMLRICYNMQLIPSQVLDSLLKNTKAQDTPQVC